MGKKNRNLERLEDAWRTTYSYAIGAVELVENAAVNIVERCWRRKIDDSEFKPIDGKVCLVTGANAGIGLITAEMLAERGAHVVMACRSKERADKAAERVRTLTVQKNGRSDHPKVEVMELDLASLDSVRRFSKSFAKKGLDLSLLVCNAGLMRPPERLETQDGMEMQFQVNYLGHWLLAHELMSQKIKGGKGKSKEDARVVMVSSMAHLGGKIEFDDIHALRKYDGFLRYADSKLANISSAKEFQRRFDRHAENGGNKHTAVSVHPGIVQTELARQYFRGLLPGFVRWFMDPVMDHVVSPIFCRGARHGGESVLSACLAPDAKVAGKYMAFGKVAKCSKIARDEVTASRLWKLSEDLTDVESKELE